jgi:DNA repair and recombination protein RAD54B
MHVGYAPSTYAKPFKPPTQTGTPKPVGGYIPARIVPTPSDADSDDERPQAGPSRSVVAAVASPAGYKAISASNFYGAPKPKADKIVLGEKSRKRRMEYGGALHDPKAEGAIVMQRPSAKEAKQR